MKKIDIQDYSWVVRGKQRKRVISVMNDEPKMPTEIRKESDLSLNNTSDVLRSFVQRKLAKCLNPNEKTGRLYELTEKGMILRDKIRKKEKKEGDYEI